MQDCPDLEPTVRKGLSSVTTATLTTRLFARGLRNSFLHGISPLTPYSETLVGPAFTLRYIPAREDLDTLSAFDNHDHPQRRAIEEAPPGSVLVMDCRGMDRAASAGEILVGRLAQRGVAGLVTDGSMRDSPAIAATGFPVYSKSRSATTNLAQHHAVDLNVPIGCAEVPVYPGDIIVADMEGVVCIPRHLAEEVATEAIEEENLERFILSRIHAGVPLPGTYPPNDQTLQAYRASNGPEAP